MRTKLILLPLLLALALVAAACGGSDDEGDAASTAAAAAGDAPTVSGVWARATPDVAKQSAMYMTVTGGAAADAIVGVDVPTTVAGMTSLHETVAAEPAASSEMEMGASSGMDMGADSGMEMMEMRPVEKIEIPAGGTVELKPGGLHIMLEELPGPLKAGTTFDATIRLESGGTITATVEVKDA